MADVTALIDAVTLGDLASVEAMLAADPSLVQQVDTEGATALHHAAFMGRHEIVDALLAAGAELNARDGRHGATPAGWALHRLRERGALLAVEIDDLAFALERGDEAWVRRLVTRHPALKTACDGQGRPIATYARVRASPILTALFATADHCAEG